MARFLAAHCRIAPITEIRAPTWIVRLRPRLSIAKPAVRAPIAAFFGNQYGKLKAVKGELLPPPENVLLMAPMIEDVCVVLKNAKKFGEAITSVITPES